MISARYDAHLIFDNSPTPERYFYSAGSATVPSGSSSIGASSLSVKTLSAPNSLRLSWCSGRGWRLGGRHWSRAPDASELKNQAQGDTLSLWCYAQTPIEAAALPLLALGLHGRQTLAFRLGRFMNDLSGGQWQQVKIPLTAFGRLYPGEQDLLEAQAPRFHRV